VSEEASFAGRIVGAHRPRIGILCLSAIPDDPRVRRQGDLMAAAGWDVVAIGLPGHRSSTPDWMCLAIDVADPSVSDLALENKKLATIPTPRIAHVRRLEGRGTIPQRVRPIVRATSRRLRLMLPGKVYKDLSAIFRRVMIAATTARVCVQPSYVRTAYWRKNQRFQRIFNLACTQRVNLWLANDWTMLPIAARLAVEQGVPYAYDTHELGVDEYAHSLKWRLLHRPMIKAAEGGAIGDAAFVTCVSDGIADRLQEVHRLKSRPVVIRNTPNYQAYSVRPTGESIGVLYHGVVSPGRGLEACIRSVALWRPEFRLTVRGPASEEYLTSLRKIARHAGVMDRITFDPPVPMTELVLRAAVFDVGLFALPPHSKQNVHVLPNKFFEYMMAGLALVVSELPEMKRLLRHHDLGLLIETVAPEAIAKVINQLDRITIDRFKLNSLQAAKALNWQTEGARFLELSRRVCPLRCPGYPEARVTGTVMRPA